jgi:hypothetical protein
MRLSVFSSPYFPSHRSVIQLEETRHPSDPLSKTDMCLLCDVLPPIMVHD